MTTTIEFFSGMGLMRAGLERVGIETVFANDIDKTKAKLYVDNWGDKELRIGDIRDLHGDDIPTADLATASFPCTDMSLAGKYKGLKGAQSGLVLDFLRILEEMGERAPRTLMIENVMGFLKANDGRDWQTVVSGMRKLCYETEHIVVNAKAFVPQSRARVFLFGNKASFSLPEPPMARNDVRLADVAEAEGDWWSRERVSAFVDTLSPLQFQRVSNYRSRMWTAYFGAFRRTRGGRAVWEVRADQIAGTLRTTRGGSAKQAILRAGCGELSIRWMNVKEYARLQGAEHLRYDTVTPYQAMFALGDAVCVPVIEWLAVHCLLPIMNESK
ncbi:MAG: DNA (cytosine-5-)-methyltransferase [Chloroflexota bacterium]|nr:DNA (cytosine-5-)-methyltransferase [Chloroflexota bacterium]MCY3582210.1 DNA (cytosine-5-)-methyltransferase [Chloroflexota bacterium]MDE2649904.1 DNA (cytosine-5-)-methyltransferase [Chloroflexota bacterium]MXX84044.1 DNA cytosine methyltransferase [Chloroflexota bacterium]MYD39506.1 DNA cytosine methyltransferase [Chloroflexota bacterium]